ncbi:MAG: 3-isopropylmalate dehydratase small subunit [Dehalococcoidia bacterium]|nr:3-isopropylmalate dehydratase small subunit [Dehalococcoidia bacterium]
MQPFVRETGVAVPLDRPNVDTDQIIPKQYLKRIERSGFGQFLFNDWRFLPDGTLDPDFELNRAGYEGATILLAGRNFGSGSSREHAPWALDDYGFRAIIAPSYADIFHSNCFKNGILPVTLPEKVVNDLMARATERPGYRLTVDLERCVVADEEEGDIATFDVDPFRRNCLLKGLDDIGLTLQHESAVTTYEHRRSELLPVTTPKSV